MEVILANPTGFCFGVKRAIHSLETALRQHGKVYSTGSPIHNPQEVSRLERAGLIVVNSVNEIPAGSVVFIRAHGVDSGTYSYLSDNNCIIIDGTCPFVTNAQTKARDLSAEGYAVLIFGDPDHPEIKAIKGFVTGECHVVRSYAEAECYCNREKIGLVSQTTQEEESFTEAVTVMVKCAKEVKVYNTICKATVERQNAIRKLANEVDAIIVIGGRNSANTARLVDIAGCHGVDVLWIEQADEIDRTWLIDKERTGIAAGASTPDWLINEVQILLSNL